MSDTEKGLILEGIDVRFPREAAYAYAVEVSMDKENWQPVASRSGEAEASSVCKVVFPNGARQVKARFVRVRFLENNPALPAAVSEIIIRGWVAD